MKLIKPHGSEKLQPRIVSVDRAQVLTEEAASLLQVELSSAAASNAVMLGAGYFSPLKGYMSRSDALSVATNMSTASGLFWPIPILNMVHRFLGKVGDRIALMDPNFDEPRVLAVMSVELVEILSDDDMSLMTRSIFGTEDTFHPGVAIFNGQGRVLLSGSIEVLNYSYFENDFPKTFHTAMQIRESMESLGWSKAIAFQTRNPMHRAHEELCRIAMNELNADGILIHMLLGKLKPGDIPAHVRDKSIRVMVENYFSPNTVLVSGYGFDMLYAGPREAVLHAVFRQNAGCSHLIVGRDHAGVGNYYGGFDAQKIFDDEVPPGALQISIYRADHTAYSKKLNRVVMLRDAPDHKPEDFITLSGTKVREMLGRGIAPPAEFSRPEVARVLMDYYREVQ